MSSKRKIVITADTDGNLTFDAQGYQGKGCVASIEKLIKAAGLDGKSIGGRHKTDYHRQETKKQRSTL